MLIKDLPHPQKRKKEKKENKVKSRSCYTFV